MNNEMKEDHIKLMIEVYSKFLYSINERQSKLHHHFRIMLSDERAFDMLSFMCIGYLIANAHNVGDFGSNTFNMFKNSEDKVMNALMGNK